MRAPTRAGAAGPRLDRLDLKILAALQADGRDDFLRFERKVQDVPHIIGCHLVGGGHDYLVHFIACDVAHYQELIEALLDQPVGIQKYFSYIAIKHIKASSRIPLELFE